MPDNEALSLVSKNTKKGASILLYKLPAIILWRETNGGKSNGGKWSMEQWREIQWRKLILKDGGKYLREENP